jgi:hypothetical protein
MEQQIEALKINMDEQGRQVTTAAKPMKELGQMLIEARKPIAAIGRKLDELGQEQKRSAEALERALEPLIIAAIANGTAKPVQ